MVGTKTDDSKHRRDQKLKKIMQRLIIVLYLERPQTYLSQNLNYEKIMIYVTCLALKGREYTLKVN